MGTEIKIDAEFRPFLCQVCFNRREAGTNWDNGWLRDIYSRHGCTDLSEARQHHLTVCVSMRYSWTGEFPTDTTKYLGWQMFQPEVWWWHFPVTSTLLPRLLFRFHATSTNKNWIVCNLSWAMTWGSLLVNGKTHLNHYLTIPGHKEIQQIVAAALHL